MPPARRTAKSRKQCASDGPALASRHDAAPRGEHRKSYQKSGRGIETRGGAGINASVINYSESSSYGISSRQRQFYKPKFGTAAVGCAFHGTFVERKLHHMVRWRQLRLSPNVIWGRPSLSFWCYLAQ